MLQKTIPSVLVLNWYYTNGSYFHYLFNTLSFYNRFIRNSIVIDNVFDRSRADENIAVAQRNAKVSKFSLITGHCICSILEIAPEGCHKVSVSIIGPLHFYGKNDETGRSLN